MLDFNKHSHLYKIKHNSGSYYGIVVKEGKTYKDRFQEHLNGVGSIEIKRLIDEGCDTSEFTIELIDVYEFVEDAFHFEKFYIKNAKKIGETLLNKNSGGGFNDILSPLETRRIKCDGWCRSLHSTKPQFFTDIQKRIHSICNVIKPDKPNRMKRNIEAYSFWYRNKCFIKSCMELSSYEITNFVENFNLTYSDIDKFINEYSKEEFISIVRIFNSGDAITTSIINSFINKNTIYLNNYGNIYLFDSLFRSKHADIKQEFKKQYGASMFQDPPKCYDSFTDSMFISKHANLKSWYQNEYNSKFNSPADLETWRKGRESYRSRIAENRFTKSELDSVLNRSKIIKESWSILSEDQITNRTRNGLIVRNSKEHICKKCGKIGLTLGNLKRWHNDRCKNEDRKDRNNSK
jgi:hypothetical protein